MLWILFAGKGRNFTIMAIRNGRTVPEWTGEMEMSCNTAGYRPHKTRKTEENGKTVTKEEYIGSKEVVEHLRKAQKIMIADGFPSKMDKQLINMLQGYQLNPGFVKVCRFCLLKNRFTQLRSSAVLYNTEKICVECAKEELTKTLRNARCNFGDKTVAFFHEVLQKTKNLDKTLLMISPDRFTPDATKYDTIESVADEKTIPVHSLPVSEPFKKILSEKSDCLLPVQSMAVRTGLFDGKNLLVVSATATGKTLIGELAGIKNILDKKGKMIFLVPLVALANQKYEQFKKKYEPIGIKTSVRIGAEMIRTKNMQNMDRSLNSDIIVGTYEGIDHILRSGNSDGLGRIGTIVIDEIHMITDSDRGHRIDGMAARLQYVAPEAQKIYLSATVANPKEFSKKLSSQLIVYEHRPVPIERHLLFVEENEKISIITKLIQTEYNKKSSKGHRGQTIIFTNSRANCHSISEALPMKSAAYHAGLHQYERKKIEMQFERGDIPVVVTTAALAAGVDFPASQVIFESLAMGISWICVQDFLQMSGRAGRPDYHDKGTVFLLPVPGKSYGTQQKGTEEEIAISLLKGGLFETDFIYDTEEKLEQTLANVCVTHSMKDVKHVGNTMFGYIDTDASLLRLRKYGFLEIKKGEQNKNKKEEKTNNKSKIEINNEIRVKPTKLGKVASSHFLSVAKTLLIRDSILAGIGPLHIVTNLEFFDAAQFKIAESISKDLKINLPTRVFQGACLDVIYDGESMSRINQKDRQLLINFASDMMKCNCKESPYCGCVERKFSEKILLLRAKGFEPAQIVKELENNYGITAYTGDIYSYLESAVRNLQAVKQIAQILQKRQILKETSELCIKIKG